MIKEIKKQFVDLLTIFECASYGGECPSLILPSTHRASVLPLTGSALCLMDLINRNMKITPHLLMSQYTVWIAGMAKNFDAKLERIDPPLIRSVHQFLTRKTTADLSINSELAIDCSSLVRLAPLAFYLDRYKTMFEKNPPVMYHLIHELSSLTVGHRRASVGCGIYLVVLRDLIGARLEKNKPLTFTRAKIVTRTAITKALLYYNSTYEYRGETGHYALLQQNVDKVMHLETVSMNELNRSSYVLDTLLAALWLFMMTSSANRALVIAATWKSPHVAALLGGLYACAYGNSIDEKHKKRFEEILES